MSRSLLYRRIGDDPSTFDSFKALLFDGPINILLLAVPFSFLSYYLHWGNTVVFITSFISIIPLAALLGSATEELSLKTGQTM